LHNLGPTHGDGSEEDSCPRGCGRALFGRPNVIAIVKDDDIRSMDAVIDQIAEISGVLETDSKLMRGV
jgi:hypothetical protein